jgi:hypothetical protein
MWRGTRIQNRQCTGMWRWRRNNTGSVLGCGGGGTRQAVYWVVELEEHARQFTDMWRKKYKTSSLLGCGGVRTRLAVYWDVEGEEQDWQCTGL